MAKALGWDLLMAIAVVAMLVASPNVVRASALQCSQIFGSAPSGTQATTRPNINRPHVTVPPRASDLAAQKAQQAGITDANLLARVKSARTGTLAAQYIGPHWERCLRDWSNPQAIRALLYATAAGAEATDLGMAGRRAVMDVQRNVFPTEPVERVRDRRVCPAMASSRCQVLNLKSVCTGPAVARAN